MTQRLHLSAQGWEQRGATHARGQAFDRAGSLLRAGQLAAVFDAQREPDAWLAAANSLNGRFAAVRSSDSGVCAVVDRLRSFPLFFVSSPDGLHVADTAEFLRSRLDAAQIDPLCAAEFRLTGYVTGAQTLVAGLSQVPAGHSLFETPRNDPRLLPYYAFRHRSLSDESDGALIERLVAIHGRVFRRLVDDVGPRQIVVPLSGGYDSRLIGIMLRDLGCREVLCYSYGIEGNWESRISQELARHLGFRWTMVPYTAEQWRRWSATDAFQHYFRAAGNLASAPHFQDWPAVHELKTRGEIAPDAIFVPGHSGDFLAGSHIPKWYTTRERIRRNEMLRSLFDAHYSLWAWPEAGAAALRVAFAARIESIVGPVRDGSPELAADSFECWDCQERQAKFIVNSMRVYESFGHEWRLPLFDHELMDFWSRVPIEGRIGRRLYFEFARRHQRLPVTRANADRPAIIAGAIRLVERTGLRPLAKHAQRVLRRAHWRRAYSADGIGWLALVAPEEFRARYTGREIGHSFFALQYLDAVAQDRAGGGSSMDWQEA
jgi:asparagine synthase (glutamine-hydrolysing)